MVLGAFEVTQKNGTYIETISPFMILVLEWFVGGILLSRINDTETIRNTQKKAYTTKPFIQKPGFRVFKGKH